MLTIEQVIMSLRNHLENQVAEERAKVDRMTALLSEYMQSYETDRAQALA